MKKKKAGKRKICLKCLGMERNEVLIKHSFTTLLIIYVVQMCIVLMKYIGPNGGEVNRMND